MTNLGINRRATIYASTQRTGSQTGRNPPLSENSFATILASQMNRRTSALETATGLPPAKYEFPPAGAPQAFKEAWESATQGMEPGDRMTYELGIWGNLHPEYSCLPDRNPMAAPPEGDLNTYQAIVRRFLEGLDSRPELYTRDQLEKDKTFFGKLRQLMDQGHT